MGNSAVLDRLEDLTKNLTNPRESAFYADSTGFTKKFGGETGIRTLDTLRYTRFPSVRLQPLGHLSAWVKRATLPT